MILCLFSNMQRTVRRGRLLVSLTRAGQQLAEKAAPNALAISRETLAPLEPKERDVLMELLNKLR